jgi:hypothetical protein
MTVRAAGARVTKTVGRAAIRHRQRTEQDTAYARSISSAVAELVATMVPHPTVATTLAVALAALLGGGDERTHDRHPADPQDTYRSYDRGQAAPPAVPGSLWDRLQ